MSQALIRSLLRKSPDGLTVRELMAATGNRQSYTLTALRKMPDTYIDRWTPVRNTHAAVWAVVEVPEDCPAPTETRSTRRKPRDSSGR